MLARSPTLWRMRTRHFALNSKNVSLSARQNRVLPANSCAIYEFIYEKFYFSLIMKYFHIFSVGHVWAAMASRVGSGNLYW